MAGSLEGEVEVECRVVLPGLAETQQAALSEISAKRGISDARRIHAQQIREHRPDDASCGGRYAERD